MPVKLVSSAIAVALLLAYLLPLVFKLKQVSLGAVIAIGVVMALVDLRQSLKSADD